MGLISKTLGVAANAVKSSGKTALSSFVNKALQGNLKDALSGLKDAPGQLLDNAGSFGQASPGDALRGMNARGDAMQNWCWYCLLPSLTSSSSKSFLGFKKSVALPWYYVQRTNTPFRTIETESIRRSSHNVVLPTSYSVGTLTLEFFMDSNNEAQNYLKTWSALVLGADDPAKMSNRGVWGLPATYKKDINIYVLSVNKKVLLNFKYMGCWPTDPQALELTSDDASVLSHSVTFSVEDVSVSVMNDKGVIDNLLSTAQGYAMSALSGGAKTILKKFGF